MVYLGAHSQRTNLQAAPRVSNRLVWRMHLPFFPNASKFVVLSLSIGLTAGSNNSRIWDRGMRTQRRRRKAWPRVPTHENTNVKYAMETRNYSTTHGEGRLKRSKHAKHAHGAQRKTKKQKYHGLHKQNQKAENML